MTTKTVSVSPSLDDGFHGARDASILSSADRTGGIAHVQATSFTRDLLKRAGVKRVKTHAFYDVAIEWDGKYSRYQLAAAEPVVDEDASGDVILATPGSGGRILQALARRYEAARRGADERWSALKGDLRNEELIRGYVRGLRRCWVLREQMALLMKGGAL